MKWVELIKHILCLLHVILPILDHISQTIITRNDNSINKDIILLLDYCSQLFPTVDIKCEAFNTVKVEKNWAMPSPHPSSVIFINA